MAIPSNSLSDIDWEQLSRQLRNYVTARLGVRANPADIDEFAQECLLHLLDPDTKCWDPKQSTLFVFACGVVWGLIRNAWRREKRRRNHANEVRQSEAEQAVAAKPLDVALDRHRAITRLCVSVAPDEGVATLLDEMLEGRERYPNCRSLEVSRREFKATKARLGRHVDQLRQSFLDS